VGEGGGGDAGGSKKNREHNAPTTHTRALHARALMNARNVPFGRFCVFCFFFNMQMHTAIVTRRRCVHCGYWRLSTLLSHCKSADHPRPPPPSQVACVYSSLPLPALAPALRSCPCPCPCPCLRIPNSQVRWLLHAAPLSQIHHSNCSAKYHDLLSICHVNTHATHMAQLLTCWLLRSWSSSLSRFCVCQPCFGQL
jgi:hypothetical protein